ncbi:hypothetical protein [Streptomyces thermolineatus]|uniref:hypothetical protein n=1 Tax=Streptomyces thermolineatus TaxID=44033 RepID=UPI00384CACA9
MSRRSPTSTRRAREACSSQAGAASTGRYGRGRRSTAGRVTGACAMIIDRTNPRKTECTTAS